MANDPLPSGYLEAGQDFFGALKRLGLVPEALFWAQDKTIDEFVLVLITSHFDTKGPKEIYRLLTQAYNLAATPATISPFIVRLHSPSQAISEAILHSEFSTSGNFAYFTLNRGDLTYRDKWIYTAKYKNGSVKVKKLSPIDRSRQWKRFKENVERLAA
jgi:hypothetical protein